MHLHPTGNLSHSASNLACAATFVADRAGGTPAGPLSALLTVADGASLVGYEECVP